MGYVEISNWDFRQLVEGGQMRSIEPLFNEDFEASFALAEGEVLVGWADTQTRKEWGSVPFVTPKKVGVYTKTPTHSVTHRDGFYQHYAVAETALPEEVQDELNFLRRVEATKGIEERAALYREREEARQARMDRIYYGK